MKVYDRESKLVSFCNRATIFPEGEDFKNITIGGAYVKKNGVWVPETVFYYNGNEMEKREMDGGRSKVYEIKYEDKAFAVKELNEDEYKKEWKMFQLINYNDCGFIYGYSNDDLNPYIIMNLTDGTLWDISGNLSFDSCAALVQDVASTLRCLFIGGGAYIDVKPANIGYCCLGNNEIKPIIIDVGDINDLRDDKYMYVPVSTYPLWREGRVKAKIVGNTLEERKKSAEEHIVFQLGVLFFILYQKNLSDSFAWNAELTEKEYNDWVQQLVDWIPKTEDIFITVAKALQNPKTVKLEDFCKTTPCLKF
tara:strand:- start:723 stop:1646 length:924 start_codon:yes stop_codon:yes gene_type:complete